MTYSKNKTQKSIVREEPPLFDLISPKKKYKYVCNCIVCKGKEAPESYLQLRIQLMFQS